MYGPLSIVQLHTSRILGSQVNPIGRAAASGLNLGWAPRHCAQVPGTGEGGGWYLSWPIWADLFELITVTLQPALWRDSELPGFARVTRIFNPHILGIPTSKNSTLRERNDSRWCAFQEAARQPVIVRLLGLGRHGTGWTRKVLRRMYTWSQTCVHMQTDVVYTSRDLQLVGCFKL